MQVETWTEAPAALCAAEIKLGRAVARPKFREETPKTIIAAGVGETFAGTGVCRGLYMSADLRICNSFFAVQKLFRVNIQRISHVL